RHRSFRGPRALPPPSTLAAATWDGLSLASVNLRPPQREAQRGNRLKLVGRTAAKPSARETIGGGHPFEASLSVSELDERDRPGPTWPAHGRALSRSALVMTTRRLCYEGRRLIVGVHLIDDTPVPLFGVVSACDYEGEGSYRVEAQLAPLPDSRSIHEWVLQIRT
ncbi:MAG: hypothetical protein AAFY58_06960, partial [Planctomycetota bacterium]